MVRRFLPVLTLILVLVISGCSKAPSDRTIKKTIRHSLEESLPFAWRGGLMGYKDLKIDSLEIKEKGRFREKKMYLLVKVKCKGTLQTRTIFGKWESHHFDGVTEFKVYQDDYGKWKAERTEL